MRLVGVMLGSENPKELGAFYTKVLGKAGWENGDWFGFDVGTGNLMVGPHSEVKGKSDAPGRIITNFEAVDVQAEFERIKALGAEVVAVPYQPDKETSPKVWLATFADPDGNYFQLASPWES